MRSHRPDPTFAPPAPFRPLVTAIAGSSAIRVRTGAATSAALAAAGRPAATVGRVIHLERPLDNTPHSAGILAHELVHAARPSAEPRFFDDDRHSTEESLARATGGLVKALSGTTFARSGSQPTSTLPVGSGANIVGAPAGRTSSVTAPPPTPIRRSLGAGRTAAPNGGGTAASGTAGATAASGATAAAPDFLQRSLGLFARAGESGASGAPGGNGALAGTGGATGIGGVFSAPVGPQVLQRFDDSSSFSTMGDRGMANTANSPASTPTTTRIPPETIESIIEAVEERVIAELERRGLRYNPGVF